MCNKNVLSRSGDEIYLHCPEFHGADFRNTTIYCESMHHPEFWGADMRGATIVSPGGEVRPSYKDTRGRENIGYEKYITWKLKNKIPSLSTEDLESIKDRITRKIDEIIEDQLGGFIK